MKIVDYIRDTKGELKHVSWLPSRMVVGYTVLVVAVVIAVSLFLAVFDGGFGYLIERFVLGIR